VAEDRIAALLGELKSLREPALLQRVESFLESATTKERAGLAMLFLSDWQPSFDRSPALVALRREWQPPRTDPRRAGA